MTRVVWDNIEERVYFAGVDRGVIYLPPDNAFAAVWNGLISVTDSEQLELKKYYYEGRTALTRIVHSEYSGKIEAITYPPFIEALAGAVSWAPGINVHNLLSADFHMTYRTKIGDSNDGTDHGYVIHLLYYLKASFDDVEHKTLGETIEPTTFSWTINATERYVKNNYPITHVSIDSREVDPGFLATLEDQLYGTDATAPFIPDPTGLIP
jgi:hypothetical protein